MKKLGIPADPLNAQRRAVLREWVGPVWLGIIFLVFLAAQLRNWFERGRMFVVGYPSGEHVAGFCGMSILDVSRRAGRPHMSVCGGRGRCTTCRVRIVATDADLPAPNEIESRALSHIHAPSNLRLACQTRPVADVEIYPLLHPDLVVQRSRAGGADFGHERRVTVLFIDLRGSTTLAENRMPYDVTFLLNHFFKEMAEAVDVARGHYSNFTGDGLMALFGVPPAENDGARDALQCAVNMLDRMERINQRLAGELKAPITIGVGIHTGLAIVGTMGPPKTPILSAVGDTVNTTARLEGLTKDLHKPIVVSVETLRSAGLETDQQSQLVQLRGRATEIQVVAFDAAELSAILSAQAVPLRTRTDAVTA